MKKWVLLIAMVVLFFTSCSHSNASQPLTADEALSIVQERVKDCEDELFCEYNGKQSVANDEYHRIRVYTISTKEMYDADGSPYKQSFTYAWLYVDVYTGEIYQEQSGKIGVLVPWP